MTSWADIDANQRGIYHVRHVVYTVQGTGQPDPMGTGYPADLARALDPDIWEWQPVGNYPATAFPMQPSIDAGEAELVRLITQVHPDRTFALVGYSQGAIITSNVYDRLRFGDLQQYRDQLIAGVTWGNPRREQGHTIPGGIDPRGHGIVTPNLVNTEDLWWDFACGATMVNSPGQDLYTTCGYDGNAESVADEEAIWDIVDKGTLTSAMPLAEQVFKLVMAASGGAVAVLPGGISAVVAILDALNFFVIKGISPHTSYQVVQPRAGDPRDCWRMALDYLNTRGAQVPARLS